MRVPTPKTKSFSSLFAEQTCSRQADSMQDIANSLVTVSDKGILVSAEAKDLTGDVFFNIRLCHPDGIRLSDKELDGAREYVDLLMMAHDTDAEFVKNLNRDADESGLPATRRKGMAIVYKVPADKIEAVAGVMEQLHASFPARQASVSP